MNKTSIIARIENALIFNSKYNLTAKEQKVILLLISKIDPIKQTRLYVQTVSFKEMESILMSKKNGSFKKEFQAFSKRLLKKQLSFKTDMVMDGENIDGYMNWFQVIRPKINDNGDWDMEFMFAEILEPFLLDLKEYTQIDIMEVMPFVSGFSVRLYQIFKAYRTKMAKHQMKSKISYEVNDLKDLLGVSGLYTDFRNFKRKVLFTVEKEINEHTSISVKFTPIKKGRRVVGINFEFWDKVSKEASSPVLDTKNFDSLTFAQVKAYNKLTDYKINESIALEMIAKCQGSEFRGFEDLYFAEVISIFESKTNQQGKDAKAGTLVNWYLKKKVFEQGDMFAKIMEVLQAKKKKLQKDAPKNWDNRLLAREMTAEGFRKKIST